MKHYFRNNLQEDSKEPCTEAEECSTMQPHSLEGEETCMCLCECKVSGKL